MKIALKIDAATFRGTLIGVPRLVEVLRQAEAQATFFFNLGPDHSGRRLGAMLAESRPGASALGRHGLATLLYGTLLPAPDVGRRCADILRGVREAGFDTGVDTAVAAAIASVRSEPTCTKVPVVSLKSSTTRPSKTMPCRGSLSSTKTPASPMQ